MLRKVNKWKTDSGKRNSFSTKTIRHCQMVPQLIERRKSHTSFDGIVLNAQFFDEFRPYVQAKGKIIRHELKQSHERYF